MQLMRLTEALPQLNLVDERTNVHDPPGEARLLYVCRNSVRGELNPRFRCMVEHC